MPSEFRPSLIAIDLDGTLLRSDHSVSARAKRAIAALQGAGVDVIACTGRPARRVRHIAAELSLPRAIVYQGSATYHPNEDRMEVHRQMSSDVALGVIERLRATYADVMCGIETDRGWFVDDALVASGHVVVHPGEPGPSGTGDVADFVRDGVLKLLARHPSEGARDMAAALGDADVYRTWTTPDLLEILSDGVNKQVALAAYASSTGVSRQRVAAFGDQHNDREMLAWAGLGVAMANGSEEARGGADLVTTSNDEDGVARILETWCEAVHG